MKSNRFLKPLFLFCLISVVIIPNFFNKSEKYISLAQSNLSPTEERKALEEELKNLEEQISKYEQDITKTEQEKKTLQNQISILKKKIDKLNLQIEQGNVMVKDLGLQITDTESSIEKTSLKIDDSKNKLVGILRTIYEEDQKSNIEILLVGNNLSDFFDNVVALESLNSKNQELLKEIKSLKVDLENQKSALEGEKTDLENTVKIQTLQRKQNEANKKDQESLLKLTEAQYQESLQEKQAAEQKAAEIRSRIFELIGVPKAPTFGEAYEIAKYVETITGVRPAFLLAVLTQESDIGQNVGQCYLTNQATGAGIVIYSGKEVSRVMNPSRDLPYFLEITGELGRDPYKTPVSCPMSYGWGGAMGPAQFIPSTWALYRDEIKKITGKATDPWSIKDAFLAAALYLADSGAAQQTYNSEWRAAIIYFAGSVNLKYRFYGDSVMSIAASYEDDIKQLEGS